MKSNEFILESKRGYLKGDFELFHLKDRKNTEFEYHYHDFSKIIVFISGRVTYLIEGKAYKLKPWDILLVSSKEIHRPIIDSTVPYERVVIWVNPTFLERHSTEDCNLSACFTLAADNNCNVLRLDPEILRGLRAVLSQLEEACKGSEFGSRILKNSLFMQLIVSINRRVLEAKTDKVMKDIEYDERINKILEYVNQNLSEELSIDAIAAKHYLSKYYLMHKFKQQTGYSIHNYILQKRLIEANFQIKKGKPASEVCAACGFNDYSSFVRAFKKMFGLSPRNYYKSLLQLENTNKQERHF
ncbi:MAG: AraC family transcriptional regulator [Clostridia bacterium]|nr:AraC family transcriptional regulator [Clostridia bacterium]